MHALLDPFDPNHLFEEHEHRVYGDEREGCWAVVDEEDYQWAVQWRWNPKREPGGALYLRRSIGGGRTKWGRQPVYTLYLHVEIMKLAGTLPPSDKHVLVDHRDGDSLNCRRRNLQWVTYQQNRLNRYGNRALSLWG